MTTLLRPFVLWIALYGLMAWPALAQSGSSARPAGNPLFEYGTNRNGSDYASFDVAADPQQCMERCRGDGRCRAWTYVHPGVQGPNARCWLKSPAPAPSANACCISGTFTRIVDQSSPIEIDTNRQGSDFANIEMPVADPYACQAACTADGRCAAWTFVRPGVQGPNARCYLKNPAPPASVNNCCISGVSRGAAQPPVPPPPQPPAPPPGAIGATWFTSARGDAPDGQRLSFMCPPIGADGARGVWGTDIYTYDSGICTAGLHSGVITRERGGVVTIEMRPGLSAYAGSLRNGVSSNAYSAYNKSFAIVR